jgi:hypothetical protein
MLKKTVLMVAVAAFSGSAMASEWGLDDPYWKKGFEGTTYSPIDQSGAQKAEGQNAERQTLERAGFPQFAN